MPGELGGNERRRFSVPQGLGAAALHVVAGQCSYVCLQLGSLDGAVARGGVRRLP